MSLLKFVDFRVKKYSHKNCRGYLGGFMTEEKLNKMHARYWEKRLVHPNGTKVNGSLTDWYIRLNYQGKQSWVNMQTPNRALASQKAKEAYFLVRSQGWDALWAKYGIRKGKEKKSVSKEKSDVMDLTIGEFVRHIMEKCSLSSETLNAYINALGKIAADIFNVKDESQNSDDKM
jgi:hypothetical protein